MLRKSVVVFVAMALVLSVAVPALAKGGPPPWAGAGGKGRFGFNDMDQARWAEKHVYKMQLKGIVEGRGNGLFCPNAPVKRAEAITMIVRALGYDEEAAELKDEVLAGGYTLELWDAARIPLWAVGYVGQAVELGLVDAGTTFMPNQPAKRMWVTDLITRAIDVDEEDLWDFETGWLDFNDLPAIPQGMLPVVAFAVEHGLIRGYPNGTFQPNKPVTRAEMAALIDRLEGKVDEGDEAEISGRVLWVDQGDEDEAARIRVREDDGTRRTLEIDPEVAVFVDGGDASLEDVERGMRVDLELSEEGLVVLIDASTEYEVSGIVVSIDVDEGTISIRPEDAGDDEAVTYELADDVTVRWRGREAEIEDVCVGDEVELRIEGDEVVRIVIEEIQECEIEGYFVGFDEDGDRDVILLKEEADDPDSDATAYPLRDRVEDLWVWYRGDRVTASEILEGDLLEVKMERGFVVRVVIEEREEFEVVGEVVYLDPDDREIALDVDGDLMSLAVDEDVEVSKGPDDDLTLEDVSVGDTVEVKVEGGIVVRIRIEEDYEVEEISGTVIDIDPDELTMVVRGEDEGLHDLTIDEDVTVKYRSVHLDLEDVEDGDEVTVRLVDGVVVKITIEEREKEEVSLEGTVRAIDVDEGTFRVRVTVDSEEVDYTVYVDEDTEIEWDGEEMDVEEFFDALSAGVEIQIVGTVEGHAIDAVEITVED